MGVHIQSNPGPYDYKGVTNPYQQYSREGNAANYLIDAFQRLMGRNPTSTEIAKYLPAYVGADKNITDVSAGDSLIAQAAQQQTSPDTAKPKYGNVDTAFQSVLGRSATQEEKDHFGTLIANGQLDDYSLGQWLQQLPESVQKQDATFRSGLTNDLQSQDERYFKESILPSIQSSFLKSGRSVDSSGYATALAQAAGAQNRDRESFLSNLTASQYGGSSANARQDYLNNMSRGYQQQDAMTGRINDISNFNMQQQAYNSYLQRYGKRSQLTGGLQGAFGGAMAGGAAGGPWGALAGGIGGGALGAFG